MSLVSLFALWNTLHVNTLHVLLPSSLLRHLRNSLWGWRAPKRYPSFPTGSHSLCSNRGCDLLWKILEDFAHENRSNSIYIIGQCLFFPAAGDRFWTCSLVASSLIGAELTQHSHISHPEVYHKSAGNWQVYSLAGGVICAVAIEVLIGFCAGIEEEHWTHRAIGSHGIKRQYT